MPTKKSVEPFLKQTQPRALLSGWQSGIEEIDLDEIEAARETVSKKASTAFMTHEVRKLDGRVVVYEPTLELRGDGFTLHYANGGYWDDDNEVLEVADGEHGRAEYTQQKDGNWLLQWYAKEDPTVPHVFTCKELESKRDWRRADFRVRNAQFRKKVIKRGSYCVVTGETNHTVLDAAHICEVRAGGRDLPLNGLVMRRDIHSLFDRGFIKIDSNGKVTMKPVLTSYKHLFKDNGEWKVEPKIPNLAFRRKYINLRNEKKHPT